MSTNINVGAGAILAVVALGGVAFVGYKVYKAGGDIKNAFNPMSDQNLAYKGATATSVAVNSSLGLSGEVNGHIYDDYFFAGIDLINPWNESDVYAKKVYGLGEQ